MDNQEKKIILRKLSIEECLQIKEEILKVGIVRFNTHKNDMMIAQKFNTSASTVRKLRLGQHWACEEIGSYEDWITEKENNNESE